MKPLRLLSFGAGVQSTAVLWLSLEGRIDPFDLVLFADTGNEPPDVYEHVAACFALLEVRGIAHDIVSGGHVLDIKPFGTGGALDVPWHVDFNDGKTSGLMRRQCTSKLKIAPMRRRLRDELKRRGGRTATQALGISLDEVQRMKPTRVAYLSNEYPLVELGWTRSRCLEYLAELGIRPPRSACVVCPFHTDKEWREIRDEQPAEWARAVTFERRLQASALMRRGVPFLHKQKVPLDEVDLTTREDHGQLSLDDECEGVCFT